MEDDIGTPVDPEPTPEPEPALDKAAEWQKFPKCKGLTEAGLPCGRAARRNSDYCSNKHDPGIAAQRLEVTSAPAPKKPEGKLEPYPFHDGAVNENAAIRMIRMVIPQCPVDSLPEIKNKDGSYTPNPNFSGEQNCQMAYKINNAGVWDVAKCESLGHDPWHTTFRRPILKEVLDDDGFVVDTKVQYKVEKRLNIIQVSLNQRHSNGMEVALAQAKGCRFLESFGIASPCEFRNCSQPQRIDTRYGKYCSERHARLVAADERHMMLPVGGDPYSEGQAMDERQQMLDSINIRKGG